MLVLTLFDWKVVNEELLKSCFVCVCSCCCCCLFVVLAVDATGDIGIDFLGVAFKLGICFKLEPSWMEGVLSWPLGLGVGFGILEEDCVGFVEIWLDVGIVGGVISIDVDDSFNFVNFGRPNVESIFLNKNVH